MTFMFKRHSRSMVFITVDSLHMHINIAIGLPLSLYLDLIIILNVDAKCIENWLVWDGHGSLKVIDTVDTDML